MSQASLVELLMQLFCNRIKLISSKAYHRIASETLLKNHVESLGGLVLLLLDLVTVTAEPKME